MCVVVCVQTIACCLNTMPCGLFCCATQNSNIRVFVSVLTRGQTLRCHAKTNCLYPCRDGPWQSCSVCPSSEFYVYAAKRGNHPSVSFDPRECWIIQYLSSPLVRFRLGDYTTNHNLIICAVGALHASSFQHLLMMRASSFVVTSLCRNDNRAPVEVSFTKMY